MSIDNARIALMAAATGRSGTGEVSSSKEGHSPKASRVLEDAENYFDWLQAKEEVVTDGH